MDYINIPERRGTSPKLHQWVRHTRTHWLRVLAALAVVLFLYRFILSSSPNIDLGLGPFGSASYKDQFAGVGRLNRMAPNSPLRAQLAHAFPYNAKASIPKSIFQTWKVGPEDNAFPRSLKAPFESWTKKNPNHVHTLIPDALLDAFVEQEFANVPSVVEAWHLLPKIILKADFFRYLVVFARGGVYSDTDTFCLKPIDEWALYQEEYRGSRDKYVKGSRFGAVDRVPHVGIAPSDPLDAQDTTVGLVIGIEADPDRPDWAEWYARRIQFVQWTLMGKRGHPLLRELIARIVEETLRRRKMGTLNKIEGKDWGGDVMHWTGPGVFTDVALDYMNNVQSPSYGTGFGVGSTYWVKNRLWGKGKQVDEKGMPLHEKEMAVNWETFTGMSRPGMVDDVMVLPITGFSPGVGQMGARKETDPLAFVRHTFSGTWKPEEERMH